MENSNCDQLSVKTEENDPKSQDIKIESETLQEITNAAMANAKTITNTAPLPTFTSADLNALETMYISTNDRLNTASSSITATSADTSEIGSEPGSTKKSSQKTKKLKEKTKKTKGKKKKPKKEESDEDARRLEEFLGTDKSVTYDTNAYELL